MTTTTPSINTLMTTKEVAEILRVDDTCIRRWVKQGIIEAVILPSKNAERPHYRIKRGVLDAILSTPVMPLTSQVL